MLEYCVTTLQHTANRPMALLFALVLGIVSAATSSCCTFPVLGVLVGYSGTRDEYSRRKAMSAALCFTGGTIVSLMIIGGIAGFVGESAQTFLGRYWKITGGIIAIMFGLVTLNMLPFRLPSLPMPSNRLNRAGTGLAGFVLGGGVAACSLPCNPGIFLVLGASLLQGQVIWAALLLGMFAVGFSLPLGAVLFGVSLGRVAFSSKSANVAIRSLSGCLLLLAGFYLLLTF